MTGQNNVHIQVTGASNDDITKIARRTDVLGLSISDEILMRDSRPSVHIHGGDEE